VRFSVPVLYINKNSDDAVGILAKPFLPLSCDGCLADLTGIEIFLHLMILSPIFCSKISDREGVKSEVMSRVSASHRRKLHGDSNRANRFPHASLTVD
jgi:hypothetical protein